MQETFLTRAPRHHANLLQVLQSYYQLTKPRIILLLLITTAAGMWLAAQGSVDPQLLLITLTGGATAAASANTINCLYDRDIDYVMERTRHRPLPSGRVQPRDALLFAIGLAVFSFTLLTLGANLLSALLAMAGIVFYVLVYTHWLKRHSTQNIVIGGAAGAIPPLVGWAAVTNDLGWPAWVLFAIVFVWTPPHFWALAMMIRDDYAKVGVPMLPVVEGEQTTSWQIWLYTLLLLPVTLLLAFPLQVAGVVYTVAAFLLGAVFIQKAWALWQDSSNRTLARSLFKFSIFYLMLLSAALVVDSLPVFQPLTQQFAYQWSVLLSAIPMLAGI